MSEDRSVFQIELSPTFVRRVRILQKRYRHIRRDLEPVIEQLQGGQILGEQIQGIGSAVFKVRIRNQDIQKGKSGGYRMIYYLKEETKIILLTIYSKSEQTDITAKEIREIISE